MTPEYYRCACEASRAQGIAMMCFMCDHKKIPKTMIDIIRDELQASRKVITDFLTDEANLQSIQNAAEIMINCLKNGGKIIACGNGGSMCDAMHFASELTGKYRKDRPPIDAVAIGDPAYLSCVGNDYGYTHVFGRYIKAHARKGDILLALSTSGNSDNIIIAAHEMHTKQCGVVYITGNDKRSLVHKTALIGGGDCLIEVPHSGTADRTQEVTILILHILVHLIEKGLGYA